MQIFLVIASIYLLLSVIYLVRGPSVWDRLLGMNVVSTKVVILIIVYASIRETAYFLDLAIIFALFGFICTIFIAIFLSEREKKGRNGK